MAQLTIRINGYGYTIGCQDGEEQHLQSMAAEVERRIDTVKTAAGPGGEARMLVMAALVLADDLFDTRKKLAELEAMPAGTAPKPDRKLGNRLNRLAKRAEDIAAELEQP